MAIKISNAIIDINGSNSVAEYLRTEFSNMPKVSDSPDISLSIQPGYISPPKSGLSVNDQTYIGDNSVFIDRRVDVPIRGPRSLIRNYVGTLGRQIQVNSGDGQLNVDIHYDPRVTTRNSVVDECVRLLNRSYIYRSQNLAKVILYNDIEPLLHQLLIDTGTAFLHASGIEWENKGIVFSGWGGTGKTSLVSELAGSDTTSMIADDLCLVTAEQTICPYHKRVQLYPYNLTEQDRDYISDQSILNQVNWKLRRNLLGKDAVRRRLSPDALHPICQSNNIDISMLVYLSREERNGVSHEPLAVEDFSSRAVGTIAHEFQTHLKSIRVLSATGPNFCTSELEYLSKTNKIYEESFSSADRVLLRIPQSTTPTDLAEYVRSNLIQNINE